MKNIAIVGGSSDIALSTITSLSSEDYDFYVIIRDEGKSSVLTELGAHVTIGDATSEEDIKNFVSSVKEVGAVSYTHLTLPTIYSV